MFCLCGDCFTCTGCIREDASSVFVTSPVCGQNTSPCAHTHIFSRCVSCIVSLLSQKSFHLIHVQTAPCWMQSCPHSSLHLFQHRHPVLLRLLHCFILQRVQPLPHSAGRVPLWPLGRTELNDLATMVDASEIVDTTDVRRLVSPLFSKEREVSANPFNVSGSQAHSSVWEPMRRDTDLFSSIGKLVRGVESLSNVE